MSWNVVEKRILSGQDKESSPYPLVVFFVSPVLIFGSVEKPTEVHSCGDDHCEGWFLLIRLDVGRINLRLDVADTESQSTHTCPLLEKGV